ncbi:type II toxin-antitoxin system Phd/YefM family antitoxin [Halomonas cerina]|uniref:Antitoxin n=1 Tax=Halomonas cerina TaxID=447424 RepID=A0A839VHT1_9GAMM|nr:prevent-host-death family protein [Halomonas cerina]
MAALGATHEQRCHRYRELFRHQLAPGMVDPIRQTTPSGLMLEAAIGVCPRLPKAYGITYYSTQVSPEEGFPMSTITASEARANLYRLIDEAAESHQPLLITGKRNKAVLIAEEDWQAIQETLFLLSVPGMRESIREGMDTPIEECDEALDW